jgi:hypothetical protein
VQGPLTLVDYTGLDTHLYILRGWVKNYPKEPAFFVPKLLEDMVCVCSWFARACARMHVVVRGAVRMVQNVRVSTP